MKKKIHIFLFVIFLDIFLIKALESSIKSFNKYSYQDIKEVEFLLTEKIPEFNLKSRDIIKIINSQTFEK